MVTEIPFTEEHVEKIKSGEKTTTMRTVKQDNLYPVGRGEYALPDGTPIKLWDRAIVFYSENTVEWLDSSPPAEHRCRLHEGPDVATFGPLTHEQLADREGFEDPEEMLEWFKNRGYNLPQPFFLYSLEVSTDGS